MSQFNLGTVTGSHDLSPYLHRTSVPVLIFEHCRALPHCKGGKCVRAGVGGGDRGDRDVGAQRSGKEDASKVQPGAAELSG